MNRPEFLALLTRLVKDRKLTEKEAGAMLRQFDNGEIDENDLPLPLKEAIAPITQSDVDRAMEGLRELGVTL
jgi:hypothetical protein